MPIDPTIVVADSKIVHVCKVCGSEVKSRAKWKAEAEAEVRLAKESNAVWMVLSPLLTLFCGWLAYVIFVAKDVSVAGKFFCGGVMMGGLTLFFLYFSISCFQEAGDS